MERASASATGSGRAMARFFGASSPMTIWVAVARTNATVSAMPGRALSETPSSPTTGSSAAPIVGWAMKPTTSEVTVMPSCAPDSMNESCERTASARDARLSPRSPASTSRPRRAATKANSPATK